MWRAIVTSTRKSLGDNADAIYFDTPISGAYAYRVTGNLDGAVYTSFTIEEGGADGGFPDRTGGVFNDTHFDVDADGNYEIFLGGAARDRNWMALTPAATRITTRHYWEELWRPAAMPVRDPEAHDRGARRRRAAAVADRRVGRRRVPPGHELRAHPHRRHGPADAGRAARVRVARAERVPAADAARRPRARRDRRVVLDGAVRARARRGAGHDGPVARVPVRERQPLEPAPADVRLRAPDRRAEPGPDRARARRHVPRRDRAPRPGRAQLARHRGPAVRPRVLALLPARGPDRDARWPRSSPSTPSPDATSLDPRDLHPMGCDTSADSPGTATPR